MEWYAEWYAAEHPTTVRTFRYEIKSILKHFGARAIDTIRPTEIEQWKVERLAKLAPETVGKERG